MKIKVLVENIASGKMRAEWGLSYLIESDERILFDTGASDLFMHNAAILGESLEEVEKVVLSHGHWDHGTGLQYLQSKTLYAHEAIFKERYSGPRSIGLPFTREFLEERMTLSLSKGPQKVSENITFLGEIPRESRLENSAGHFTDKEGSPDLVEDDSGIAVTEKGRLIVITGCAHAGVINTIEHAKKLTGISQVAAVVGGFHLQGNDEITTETIRYLKEHHISRVYPSHCNQFPALVAFHNKFGSQPLKVGDTLEI